MKHKGVRIINLFERNRSYIKRPFVAFERFHCQKHSNGEIRIGKQRGEKIKQSLDSKRRKIIFFMLRHGS